MKEKTIVYLRKAKNIVSIYFWTYVFVAVAYLTYKVMEIATSYKITLVSAMLSPVAK